MPLWTYVVVFEGAHHVAQARRSNLRGFPEPWTSGLPADLRERLGPKRLAELSQKAYREEFAALPNRQNVWRQSLDLGGAEFTVYAIRTDGWSAYRAGRGRAWPSPRGHPGPRDQVAG